MKNYTGTSTAINITAGEPELVYNASNGKGWTWDIALDENEKPVILFATFPNDTNHMYYYSTPGANGWNNQLIVNSGRWFPQTVEGGTEAEPNYSGGMVLDPNDPSIVYLSKQVEGIFEIYKYTTNDKGATWKTEAITRNTPAGVINVRPVIPRGHKPGSFDVMWLRGTYVTYANYLTSVMYYSPNSLVAQLDSIAVNDEIISNLEQWNEKDTIEVQLKANELPTLQAYSAVPNTSFEIEQASNIPGIAKIKVISDGTVVSKTFVVHFSKLSSTEKLNERSEVVYPNPTNGKVFIDLSSFKNVTSVNFFDVKGRANSSA